MNDTMFRSLIRVVYYEQTPTDECVFAVIPAWNNLLTIPIRIVEWPEALRKAIRYCLLHEDHSYRFHAMINLGATYVNDLVVIPIEWINYQEQ